MEVGYFSDHRTSGRFFGWGEEQVHAANGPRACDVLNANAFLMAREAAERYREFGELMADRGWDTVAECFRQLAKLDGELVRQLARRIPHIEMTDLDPADYAWLSHDAMAPGGRAFVLRMLTPRLALEIALGAKQQAKDYFERVRDESGDAEERKLASDLARGEQRHIDWLNEVLMRLPSPSAFGGDPTIEQQL